MNCIQCNAETSGKYCPECGQKQNIPRLSLKTFLSDFLNRIYGLDGAVPNTIIGLWKHPGRVAKEYISGIRGKYVGPVGYYFLLFTLYLILASALNVDLTDYASTEDFNNTIENTTGEEIDEEKRKLQEQITQKIFDNIQYFTILFFPFFALWAKVFFKKSGRNFLENIVFLFFVNAQNIFFNSTGIIIFSMTGESYKTISFLLTMIYFAWAATQFYSDKVNFKNVLKSILFFIVAYISAFIFAMLIGVIIGAVSSQI